MSTLDRLAAVQHSTKRDVAAMTVAIAGRDADAPVRAVFREERYGLFEYSGRVKVVSDGSRLLAGRAFDSGAGKPSAQLRAFKEVADDGVSDLLEGTPVAATDLAHGDLAAARLDHALYGTFDVSGVALQNAEGTRTLIGEWIVADMGRPAPAVQHTNRIAGPTEHGITIPARLIAPDTDAI